MRAATVLAAAAVLICVAGTAAAQHGSHNPMMPRQLSQEAYKADYTYGFSLLSGAAVDTLQTPNRVVGWNVNYEVFDRYLLRPVAHAYAALPQPVQTGVGNFTYNLSEVNNILNNLLIGEPAASGISLGRFAINSTVGILGFIDVASYMGIERQTMSMSTVLGRADMEQGPYLMIPFYGPTTGRQIQGSTADSYVKMWWAPWFVTAGLWAVEGIHNRAQLVEQEGVIDQALDPYVQTRDIYLMYSEGRVHPDAAMSSADDDFEIDEEFLDEIDG